MSQAQPANPGQPGQVHHIRNVVVIWAIITLFLELLTIFLPSHLYGLDAVAADRTADYVLTMMVFTVLAVPVFAMVVAFGGYSAFRFRSRGQPMTDGPHMVAGRGIQFAWVGISVVLVLFLYGWGLFFLNRADAAPPPGSNVLEVDVAGSQWTWTFTYPQYNNIQSDTLVVPVNRPILFKITSMDVTHSFSVPAWSVKMDANPGYFTYIRVTPNTMGTFPVRCYELCGMFHAYMQTQAQVVSQDYFTGWVTQQPTGYPWGIKGVGLPNSSAAPYYPPGQPTPTPAPGS